MVEINPFKYFKTSPEIIRLAVMVYVRYPLSFRQVEDILHDRGIDICHEAVRYWVARFGRLIAGFMLKNLSNFSLYGVVSIDKHTNDDVSVETKPQDQILELTLQNLADYPVDKWIALCDALHLTIQENKQRAHR